MERGNEKRKGEISAQRILMNYWKGDGEEEVMEYGKGNMDRKGKGVEEGEVRSTLKSHECQQPVLLQRPLFY